MLRSLRVLGSLLVLLLVLPALLIGRYVLGRHRLRALKMPRLQITKAELEEIVGTLCDECVDEQGAGFSEYTYGLHHGLRVWFGADGRTIRYVYLSSRASPASDLAVVLQRYGDGLEWKAVEPGYLYVRVDGALRVNCSAMPMIGVAVLAKQGQLGVGAVAG